MKKTTRSLVFSLFAIAAAIPAFAEDFNFEGVASVSHFDAQPNPRPGAPAFPEYPETLSVFGEAAKAIWDRMSHPEKSDSYNSVCSAKDDPKKYLPVQVERKVSKGLYCSFWANCAGQDLYTCSIRLDIKNGQVKEWNLTRWPNVN